MTYAEALARIARQLQSRAGAAAPAEAERVLVAAARNAEARDPAGLSRNPGASPSEPLTRLQLYSRDEIPAGIAAEAERLARERAEGRLLQHVTGTQAFLDHDYAVDASVLIPRPETELLARAAIEQLREPRLGLEVGLGSGVLSIELLAAFPGLRMMASEISPEAAQVAARNAAAILGRADASRLTTLAPRNALDVLEPFPGAEADFLISNPPYLLPGEAQADVAAAEPALALWAPSGEPLHFYRAIARGASALLRENGFVFLELPPERAPAIAALFSDWKVELRRDLNGRERILVARKKG